MTPPNADSDTPEKPEVSTIQAPPTDILGILSRLGPGLIIAGSIVGSGELIQTPATGAEAGFKLLWLIVIGCIIKVWVQIELGRYTVCSGKTSMEAINGVPGPAIPLRNSRVSWLAWYWLAMFLVSLGQLGGIVGGVGQAMAIAWPMTEDGRQFNTLTGERARLNLELYELLARREGRYVIPEGATDTSKFAGIEGEAMEEKIASHQARIAEINAAVDKSEDGKPPLKDRVYDDKYYAIAVTIATVIMLVVGKYGFVEWSTTTMVAAFTAMTVATVVMLQRYPAFAIGWNDIVTGLSFQLPASDPAKKVFPIQTALAAFGIIGVGANELIQYPYWCLEKGYARFTGPADPSDAWAQRARGWMRVLTWDAWCSLFIYTFATLAFFLLGAAILGRLHLVPKGNDMIRTLSSMYEPVFGSWTVGVFLIGAFAVLYSTFFVATAGHARTCADAIRVFSGTIHNDKTFRWWVVLFSALLPFVSLAVYLIFPDPKALVSASGAMQAGMLPMLAFAAIWFRWRGIDPRVAPSPISDIFLYISAAGMLIAGGWLGYTKGLELVTLLLGSRPA
jgi:Mn2+/Fe2+ NRAMP family transporter